MYVAAFGSSKIGVFATSEIEADTFNPVTDSANYIPVSGGGPSGLVLDQARGLLYVATRFDNAVKAINLARKWRSRSCPCPIQSRRRWCRAVPCSTTPRISRAMAKPPVPAATFSATRMTLAWDLGNPDNAVTTSPIPINLGGCSRIPWRRR